tara:strand:- start:25 stop:543 length:519 start_codon:yes stop_codon:yes gene_type:complete
MEERMITLGNRRCAAVPVGEAVRAVVERIEAACDRDGASLEDALHQIEFGNDVTVVALVGYLGEHLVRTPDRDFDVAPIRELDQQCVLDHHTFADDLASCADILQRADDLASKLVLEGFGRAADASTHDNPKKERHRENEERIKQRADIAPAHAAPGRNGFSQARHEQSAEC